MSTIIGSRSGYVSSGSVFSTSSGSLQDSLEEKMGSEQEFDELPILCCFPDLLNRNEIDIGYGHAFGLEQ
jgi:hypothetical protein